MELTPFQLPYRANDSWLAMEFPADHVIEGDSMLYTAYAPALNPAASIAGLLVDEWTETIPVREETTALTFHYDRPNCEAPQTLLLVTPSTAKGVWTWQEVVASLHEALDLARLRAVEPDQLDTLEYARMSGRVGAMRAALASLMNVKPIAVLTDGALQMTERVRTRKASTNRLIAMAEQEYGKTPVFLGVVQANDRPSGQALMEEAKTHFNIVEPPTLTDLSISVAANLGPGTVGLILYPAD
jgi:hypothetical protein